MGVAYGWALSRLQMGPRGASARRWHRGEGPQYKGHYHRARRSRDRMGTTSARRARQLPAYDAARSAIAKIRTASVPGDPKATASALLRIVDAAEPPLRVFFVDAGQPMVKDEYAERNRDLGKVKRRGAGSARQSRRSLRRRLT